VVGPAFGVILCFQFCKIFYPKLFPTGLTAACPFFLFPLKKEKKEKKEVMQWEAELLKTEDSKEKKLLKF
jgi:hypothetical protein